MRPGRASEELDPPSACWGAATRVGQSGGVKTGGGDTVRSVGWPNNNRAGLLRFTGGWSPAETAGGDRLIIGRVGAAARSM